MVTALRMAVMPSLQLLPLLQVGFDNAAEVILVISATLACCNAALDTPCPLSQGMFSNGLMYCDCHASEGWSWEANDQQHSVTVERALCYSLKAGGTFKTPQRLTSRKAVLTSASCCHFCRLDSMRRLRSSQSCQ